MSTTAIMVRFFYVNAFKEARKCGGEIVEVGWL